MMMSKVSFNWLLYVVISLFLFQLNPFLSPAQSFETLIQEGAKLELAFNEKEALLKYREAQKLKPLDLNVLCKCSYLSGSIGNREKNNSIRDKYFENALSFAKIAYHNYPNSDEANVRMSVALGRIALTKSGKDKIDLVKGIKTFAENAIQLNPDNSTAWHVLGKWYYEISDLNFIEKTAVKLIFGGFPDASFKKAIDAFEKAKKLNVGFMQNYLELAKAYKKIGQTKSTIVNLNELIKLTPGSENDRIVLNEAKLILKSITLHY